MPPSAHLLHVNSRPTGVPDEVWREWYIREHLPDLVNSQASTRATFYEEIPADQASSNPRKFLALYQTDYEEPLKSAGYTGQVRTTSELYMKAGSSSNETHDNGDFNARNYTLIQEYDPNGIGESEYFNELEKETGPSADLYLEPPPQILTVEMQPKDPDDFEKWYREEHLELLSKIPGYRRSLRYKIGLKTALTKDEPPTYLAIHEVEDVQAFGGKEGKSASSTPWTLKHIQDSSAFVRRVWKLLHSEGF